MLKKSLLSFFLSLSALTLFAEAKYIFYFIGDGMGFGHVSATETYNRENLRSAAPLLMLQFPYGGQAWTYSADNRITDSAAAGTALSTGHKTKNSMIGMNADSIAVPSIALTLKNNGYAVGVASTVAGDDATPAAFYAHSVSRHNKQEIAAQAVSSGYDFFGGPVWRGSEDNNGNDNGWTKAMADAGYSVCYGYNQFKNIHNADKVLLLSEAPYGDQAGYTIDNNPTRLSAAQLTSACLSHLQQRNPDRFFMMIEAGNIDWASHGNDGGTVIKEVLDFQNAIEVAYKFYQQHPDETLIVITADHETGGMTFGRRDNERNGNLYLVNVQKYSKDRFSDYCKTLIAEGKTFTWEEMKSFLSENLGFFTRFDLTDKETTELKDAFDITFTRHAGTDEKTLYNNFNQFAVKVFDILNRAMGIGWTSGNHTATYVPIYAIGVGAEKFGRSINNIQIPMLILEAAEVK